MNREQTSCKSLCFKRKIDIHVEMQRVILQYFVQNTTVEKVTKEKMDK
ncbi:hypothetical protein Nmel_010892 [Mimus melanotis]